MPFLLQQACGVHVSPSNLFWIREAMFMQEENLIKYKYMYLKYLGNLYSLGDKSDQHTHKYTHGETNILTVLQTENVLIILLCIFLHALNTRSRRILSNIPPTSQCFGG